MSELVLVDRSFYHQGREYKSPYDWCQREYHQGKAGGRRSSFRRRVSRRIVGNGENYHTFGAQIAEPERGQHEICPIGKKSEREKNVWGFGERKRLRDLTASERIGKKKDLEISRGSIFVTSRGGTDHTLWSSSANYICVADIRLPRFSASPTLIQRSFRLCGHQPCCAFADRDFARHSLGQNTERMCKLGARNLHLSNAPC